MPVFRFDRMLDMARDVRTSLARRRVSGQMYKSRNKGHSSQQAKHEVQRIRDELEGKRREVRRLRQAQRAAEAEGSRHSKKEKRVRQEIVRLERELRAAKEQRARGTRSGRPISRVARGWAPLRRRISGAIDYALRRLGGRSLRLLGSWADLFRTREQKGGQRVTPTSRPEDDAVSRRTPGREGNPEESLTPSPFIVGVPRSGTTLLRLMLDAHPDLAIPPETVFIHLAAKACKHASDPRRAFLETVTSHRRWKPLHIEDDLLSQRVAAIEPFDLGEALRALYGLYAERFGKPRWGDKTPHYLRRMTLIQELLPEARFIHIIRDGRDVALSVKDLWFGADSVEEAARQWRGGIEKARRQSGNLSHYLEIRYEDLVLDTETTLRRICDFVDLPWSPSMLDYHETADGRLGEMGRDVTPPNGDEARRQGKDRNAILFSLANKPPQRDRIGRWRQEMTAIDRERFEEVAGETLRGLGYDVG